jgi:hypothetical protein
MRTAEESYDYSKGKRLGGSRSCPPVEFSVSPIDKPASYDSRWHMYRRFENAPAWRIVSIVFLLASAVLFMQHHSDAVVAFSFAAPIAYATAQPPPLHSRDPVGDQSRMRLHAQASRVNSSFLRNDLKQNLLVWPNIANDLTRSPPIPALIYTF